MSTATADILIRIVGDATGFDATAASAVASAKSKAQEITTAFAGATTLPAANTKQFEASLSAVGHTGAALPAVQQAVADVDTSMQAATAAAWDFDKAFGAAFGDAQKGDMQAAKEAVEGTASALENAKAKSEAFGREALATGGTLTASFTAPMVAFANSSLDLFQDFEVSMNRVSALGQIYGDDLAMLTEKAKELGAATVFSANDAAEAMGNLAAGGFSANEIMAASPGLMDLAAAGQLGMADAATIAADTLRAFSLDAGQMGHVSDVMAEAAANANMSIGQMGYTFKTVAPIATSAGLDLEQVSAAIVSLANNGIKGEQAGTGLRGVIASLISPSKEQAKVLEELGVSVLGVDGNMRPLNDVMLALKDAGVSTEQVFRLFGREAASVASILVKDSGPALEGMEQQLIGADGAARRMADTMVQGLGGSMVEFENQLESIQLALGEYLAPILSKLVDLGSQLVSDFIMPAFKWFTELPEPIQNAALAVAAVAAAAGPVLVAIGGLILLPISATMVAWAAGIAVVAGALTAIGTWIYDNWESITAVVVQAWSGIEELWGAVWGGISWYLEQQWNGIVLIWDLVFGPFVESALRIWDDISGVWLDNWGKTSSLLGDVWNAMKSGAIAAWDAVVGAISKALGWIKDNVPGMDKLLSLDEAWSGAKKVAEVQEKELQPELKKTKTEADNVAKAFGKNASSGVAGAMQRTEKQSKKSTKELEKLADITWKNENFASNLEIRLRNVAAAAGRDATEAFEKTVAESEKLNDKLGEMSEKSLNLAKIDIPEVVAALGTIPTPIDDGYDAMDRFGLKSAEEYAKVTADAQAAYEALVASGLATEYQEKSAYMQVLKAMAEESKATTGQIPKDLQAALEAMNENANNSTWGLPALKALFADTIEGIGHGFTDITAGALNTFLRGDDISLKQVGQAFKDLGADALTNFAAPFIDAIAGPNGLIQKGIKVLVNEIFNLDDVLGKVIGGVTGGISNMVGGIGGAVGSAGGAVGGAAGGAGQAAGAAGSAAGGMASTAAGGIMGVVGSIGSVVTAASSVWSNFQNIQLEKGINSIELSARKAINYLGERSDQGILGRLFEIELATVYTLKKIEEPGGMRDRLASVDDRLGWILGQIETSGGVVDLLRGISDKAGVVLGQLRDIGSFARPLPHLVERIHENISDLTRLVASDSGEITINLTTNGTTQTFSAQLRRGAAYNFGI